MIILARSQQVSKNTVNSIWQEHNLKPHRSRTFKLSRDPKFLEKLTDGVGLYLNPPDKTLVLCVDEKSQIQALDRTQPGLPLKKGRCGTFTHDYVPRTLPCRCPTGWYWATSPNSRPAIINSLILTRRIRSNASIASFRPENPTRTNGPERHHHHSGQGRPQLAGPVYGAVPDPCADGALRRFPA
jgi:hypothetical protein